MLLLGGTTISGASRARVLQYSAVPGNPTMKEQMRGAMQQRLNRSLHLSLIHS